MQESWTFLSTARLNQNGGVTLPADIRRDKGLKTGDAVVWLRDTETGRVSLLSATEYDALLNDLDSTALRRLHLRTMGITDENEAGNSLPRLDSRRKK